MAGKDAFVNNEGKSISYECSELIAELKSDIQEFGTEKEVTVWCRKESGVTLYINYDFIDKENPLKEEELEPWEFVKVMQIGDLLNLLEEQNSIF